MAVCAGILVLVSALTGCASKRIEWTSRVGVYTYDEAVLELGPPDKEATLTEGTRVADWLIRRGSRGGYMGLYGPVTPPFGPGRYYGPAYYGYYDPGMPDAWLRLTFGPEGRLVRWEKLVR
jgi:hypothetical protein